MSYNKMFKVSLSTALVAALLVGCQASDKQRTQIKRNGGGGGQNKPTDQDGTLSTSAKGSTPQQSSVDVISKTFNEIAVIGKNKEILATDLESGDYTLTMVMFDAQDSNKSKRINLVSTFDGNTVCSNTSNATINVQSKAANNTGNQNNRNTNNKNTNANTNSNQVTICNLQEVKTESALSASADSNSMSGVLGVASYLRFSVQNKTMQIKADSLATFKAGFQTQQLAMDIMPGKIGKAEDIFTLLMNAQQSQINGKNYQLKGSNGQINATIRKVDENFISIAFETIANGKSIHMVFQYKKVAKTAEAPAPTQTNPAAAVDLNKGATAETKKDEATTETKEANIETTSKSTTQF